MLVFTVVGCKVPSGPEVDAALCPVGILQRSRSGGTYLPSLQERLHAVVMPLLWVRRALGACGFYLNADLNKF